jgi:type VI secretion system protein ImpH
MATESRAEDFALDTSAMAPLPALAPLGAVEDELRKYPGRFDFFQAVRLLLRIMSERQPVGRFALPSQEAIRFSVNNTLVFPPTEIQRIQWDGDIPKMIVAFMGMTGPAGVLPYAYSEFIIGRLREKDDTMASFFDIFNHRMISLFYQAWEKHRSAVAYERDGEDRLSKYLMSLVGLGTGGLQHRLVVRDESLLFFTGLLALQPRSAVALEKLLEDYFEVSVEVEQFVGAWQSLDPSNQCVFESADSFSEQLGVGAVVGDEIWDQQSRIRVKMGPLKQAQYLSFLPGGSAYEPLRELSRFFCGTQLEIEVQLILQKEAVPQCDLGEDGLAGPRLGWFTWMKSSPAFDRAPADTVLLIA